MKDTVKNIILERQTNNENKSGTSLLKIKEISKLSIQKLIPIVNELYAEKFITIKKGINHKLIFLRNYDRQK